MPRTRCQAAIDLRGWQGAADDGLTDDSLYMLADDQAPEIEEDISHDSE